VYEIRVEGHLGSEWSMWFEGLGVRQETNGESGRPISVLTGSLPDQSALHGLLAKMQALNLTLLSVRQLGPAEGKEEVMAPISRSAAFFALLMGVLMALTWVGMTLSGEVGRMLLRPWETWSLLAAESLTAGCLVAGAIGVLLPRRWGGALNLISLGMLQYCATFSIGVFGQAGNVPAAAFFAVIALLTLILAAATVRAAHCRPGRPPEAMFPDPVW